MNINSINNQNFGMAVFIPKRVRKTLYENSRNENLGIESYERFQDAILANQHLKIFDVYCTENNIVEIEKKEPFRKKVKIYENVKTIDDLSKILEDNVQRENNYNLNQILSKLSGTRNY